jgi:hypothetical protein
MSFLDDEEDGTRVDVRLRHQLTGRHGGRPKRWPTDTAAGRELVAYLSEALWPDVPCRRICRRRTSWLQVDGGCSEKDIVRETTPITRAARQPCGEPA